MLNKVDEHGIMEILVDGKLQTRQTYVDCTLQDGWKGFMNVRKPEVGHNERLLEFVDGSMQIITTGE